MPSLSREQLVDLIQRLLNPQAGDTEDERGQWKVMIKDSVPDPKVIDYIFWDDTGMTAEQIIDKALTYKPLAL